MCNICKICKICKIYIAICKTELNMILSRINRTTMNLLLKVSRFFHDLQVNDLLTKIFVVLESLVNYLQTSGNRRIFFNCYY